MTKTSSVKRKHRLRHPPGFTLVEMLVSVAIVLVMMSMFAQVFVMSTDSLSQQRGIAENDQRTRLLEMTIRGDLNGRTFRDVLPFRANEDTRQLGHSLARRAGYFEIDEGNPSDDTDDRLSFTASVNIRLQSKDGSPFVGSAQPLSGVANVGVSGNTFTLSGDYSFAIAPYSRIWVVSNPNVPYIVSAVNVSGGNTTVTVTQSIAQTGPVNLYLSENEPEFDDGDFGNRMSISALAEVCYFLRNGTLYRRVLLIRDTPAGVDAQPTWSTGIPILWNGTDEAYRARPNLQPSTFWKDFDYSAFYFAGKNGGAGAKGVRFHNAAESLSNSSQSQQILISDSVTPAISFPMSLGIPHLRFGHSTTNGLPQDASTTVTLSGQPTSISGFTIQECSQLAFGYPGNIDNGNPYDNQNLQIDPNTGLVIAYESDFPPPRRGEDILLTNVLSFDVKVWDPVNRQFVDVGDSTLPGGPFSSNAGVMTDALGNIVGGRLNSTYGRNGHYRFDTWHPNASILANSPVTGTVFYNEPPYYGASPVPSPPYVYNEPPFVPAAFNPTAYNPVTGLNNGQNQAFPLSTIQITINFRDISSNQIRQVTIVQSLVDRVKQDSITSEAPEE